MDNPPHPYSEQKNEVVGSAIPSSAHIHTRQSPMFTDKTDGSQRNVNMQSGTKYLNQIFWQNEKKKYLWKENNKN